jgi:hypothetical protein
MVWGKWLPWIEYTYNTSCHSGTVRTPFKVVYGRAPPNLLSYIAGIVLVDSVEQALVERDALLLEVKLKIE